MGIRLFNDPSMFGRVPDPPEFPECEGDRFDKYDCKYCSEYEECKRNYEELYGEVD